jgi:murein DD-endopeptidase MepM/ murein hydrolase activator NlpD
VDLTVEVVSQRTREVVRRLPAVDVEANVPASVQWNGRAEKGSAKAGVYRFQVHAKESKVDSDAAEGRRAVGFFEYKFPVAGQHSYGDGIGAGRGHRGQDVFAECGTPLEAARAGRVQYAGFQASGAGHYVVIDGKRTGKDFVYMHLRERAELGQGDRVRTGQRIGEVGETGNASGCHLHFELWSAPGWYAGGRFLNPTPALRRWDRYS